jgi:hypothetical protein
MSPGLTIHKLDPSLSPPALDNIQFIRVWVARLLHNVVPDLDNVTRGSLCGRETCLDLLIGNAGLLRDGLGVGTAGCIDARQPGQSDEVDGARNERRDAQVVIGGWGRPSGLRVRGLLSSVMLGVPFLMGMRQC